MGETSETSAKILLEEYKDDVDLFNIPERDGVEQLCWCMKKILTHSKGKAVEIAVNATCGFIGIPVLTHS